MISLQEVSKIYRLEKSAGVFGKNVPAKRSDENAVDRLSLEITSGETVVLLGASGCGKTTTLKMINRLVEPSTGEIEVDGINTAHVDPVQLRRKIGYVFQGIGLFPHWSVADNIASTPRLLGWSEPRIQAKVDELLERMHLPPNEFRDRRPNELSGGQQQRVGVARALAAEAKVLLMDEPFGAVDPVTRDGLQHELIRVREELELTILLVTHDVTEALLLADRIAIMDRGRILQVDRPARLFANPADDVVEGLLDMPRRQSERIQKIVHGNISRRPGSTP